MGDNTARFYAIIPFMLIGMIQATREWLIMQEPIFEKMKSDPVHQGRGPFYNTAEKVHLF